MNHRRGIVAAVVIGLVGSAYLLSRTSSSSLTTTSSSSVEDVPIPSDIREGGVEAKATAEVKVDVARRADDVAEREAVATPIDDNSSKRVVTGRVVGGDRRGVRDIPVEMIQGGDRARSHARRARRNDDRLRPAMTDESTVTSPQS